MARGEGLGAALHRLGIGELIRRGADRYVGLTDVRNEPMLRVFERNGAPRTRTQTFYQR